MRLLAVISAAMLLASGAHAQQTGVKDRPCSEDRSRFCAYVLPGGGRIAACLKKHRAELHEACAQAIDREELERKACGGDYKRLCAYVLPGGGRIIACLKQHKPELSKACAEAIAGQ